VDAGASAVFAVCEFALEFLASVGAAKVRRAAAAPKKIACPNRIGNSPFLESECLPLLPKDDCGNFWKCRWVLARLLNALQTPGARLMLRSPGPILFPHQGTSFLGRALAWHHAEGTAAMRPKKPLFNTLLSHFLMGVALGLSLVLMLSVIDFFHVRDLVAKSGAPVQTTVMLVTTYGLMFGIGAALTGLVLTLEDDS
jgi:hypothetical protein